MEDAIEILGRDSYPLVFNHKLDFTAVTASQESNLSSFRGCLEGILEQVDQDLADFISIQVCPSFCIHFRRRGEPCHP